MGPLRRSLVVLLTGLASFLGVSALAGGIALLAGFHAPPVAQLEGSIFDDFVIPGLALVLVVGGGATAAAVLLLRKRPYAVAAALAAGVSVMVFEFVEVLTIGSPPGPARVMQILYFGVGAALVTISSAILAWPANGRNTALAHLQNVSISSYPNVSTAGNKPSNVFIHGNTPDV